MAWPTLSWLRIGASRTEKSPGSVLEGRAGQDRPAGRRPAAARRPPGEVQEGRRHPVAARSAISPGDQVLTHSLTFGIPRRFRAHGERRADPAYPVRHGVASATTSGALAQEMTNWFDTNYHYLVPEFAPSSS